MTLNKKRIAYWGVTGALMAACLSLSIVERGGHYEFEWRGAELMAQPKNDAYHELAALQVFNRVVLQLQQNYVDETRLDPYLMIASSLDNLQKNLPELLLVFDKKVKEKPTKVTATIGGQTRTFSLEKINNLWEMCLRMRSILAFIQDYLPRDANPRALEYDAINGMLEALDPHSVILSPEVYQSMLEGNRGKFGGLGIVVRMIDGVLIVVEPIEGDVPAKRAGMQEGDQIITIDGTPTLNMNISEAVDLLKGEPETTVHLTVLRKGWKEPRPIDVVRAEINIPSLESAPLKDKIAYIKLKSFQGNSQRDMLKALDDLGKKMGGINGLILDLRGNPGGLLDQAVMIADNFLESGTIVTTVGVNDVLQKPRTASKKNTQPSYPIIVLMDSSSASASEIVAGALKNNDRALIVGDTSFGKGSVQVLYELPDKSALKMTIGQYLTPGNRSIQSVGVVPDIRLVPMLASADGIDLYPKPWVRREETLGSHLDNQNATRDQKSSYALRYLSQRYSISDDDLDDDSVITLEDIDKLIKNKPKSNQPKDDPQVRLASEILKKIGDAHNRPIMIQQFAQGANDLQAEEDKALSEQLGKLGIDWSMDNQPQVIPLTLELSTNKPDNAVIAGDEYTITAKVTNNGADPVYRIVGRSESTFGRANDKEFIFGKIDPGQTVSRDLKIKTNHAQSSRVDNFTLKLYADDGSPIPEHVLQSDSIFLSTTAIPQPAFTIHYAIIDEDGQTKKTGNSLLDDSEKVTMRVWVSNDGVGTAEKPLIFIKNKSKEIKLVDARSETEPLKTGDRIYRDFVFETTEVGQNDVQMELHVYDKASTHSLVERISFKTSKSTDLSNTSVQHIEGAKQVNESTKLYVSPTSKSNSLMSVPPNAIVKTDAVVGDYTHIHAGEQLTGWIATTALKDADSNAPQVPIEIQTISTIPRITLKQMPHFTEGSSIELEAALESWAPLMDYYIYAASEVDHTYQFEKVAYSPLSKDDKSLRATVPLQPGLNSIRLYVRDTNKSEAHETVLVYRKAEK